MRHSRKKPVLTSPWKIGMFVALMVAVTGFAVGYYLVDIYDVDLSWLKSANSRWGIDSYQFFREMYPVAAGVILLALFAYFVITSAVRRYKYYLDSGQDYRKMVSLANSIDDLTNPAQIARLSNYPELQSVLRNYGDQISEISREMDKKSESEKSVDLEMEVESILKGEGLHSAIVEGKWWESLVRKIEKHVSLYRDESESLKSQFQETRKAAARTTLAYGRIMEQVENSGRDIEDILKSAGALRSAAARSGVAGAASGGAEHGGRDLDMAARNINAALNNLAAARRMFREFSEENNGLALNTALMAARGGISDHDLAQLAERLRSTAEKSNKLGDVLDGSLGALASGIGVFHENIGGSGGPGTADPSAGGPIRSISEKIEKQTHSLRSKIAGFGGELESLNRDLHRALGQEAADEEPKSGVKPDQKGDQLVIDKGSTFRTPDEAGQAVEFVKSGLVIDRSESWEPQEISGEEDRGAEEESPVPADGFGEPQESSKEAVQSHAESGEDFSSHRTGPSGEDSGLVGEDMGRFDKHAPGEEISLDSFKESLELAANELKKISGDRPRSAEQPGEMATRRPAGEPEKEMGSAAGARRLRPSGPSDGGDWMEMPGHQWVKIDAAQGRERAGDDADGDGEEKVYDIEDHACADDGEEKIYDLFELGAVECVDETTRS